MSAFVVSQKTMQRAVRGICAKGVYDSPIIREFGGVPTQWVDAPARIGRMLFAMNIAAVQQRYEDTIADRDSMPGEKGAATFGTTFDAPAPSRAKIDRDGLLDSYKALTCLRYQCAEGDVPEQPLFKELEAAIGKIAGEHVTRTPGYAFVPWGS